MFPEYSKHGSAAEGPPNKSADDDNGLEARAKRAAQQHTSNAQAQRPGEAGTAASKANKPKPHRFDKFALRLAASMIAAIRVSLAVFSSPDKERWPTCRLLEYLKGAEDLARDMLREIAAKIFISPQKLRKRSKQGRVTPSAIPADYAPYFRLGVKAGKDNSPVAENASETCVPLSRFAGEGSGERAADLDARPLDPPPAAGRGRRASDNESLFQNRLSALEDVLAHPGKHAARMARALYRAEHGSGARLLAKSPDDRLLENITRAFITRDSAELSALHADVMAHDTS